MFFDITEKVADQFKNSFGNKAKYENFLNDNKLILNGSEATSELKLFLKNLVEYVQAMGDAKFDDGMNFPKYKENLEAELMAYCREHISHVKCPKSIDFREELPRHPTGKLYKRLLKDEYWKS